MTEREQAELDRLRAEATRASAEAEKLEAENRLMMAQRLKVDIERSYHPWQVIVLPIVVAIISTGAVVTLANIVANRLAS